MWTLQDIIPGARRQLLADPGFSALIGGDVGCDPMSGLGKAYTEGWIFKGSDDNNAPERDPRNTGTSSIVLSARGSWTNPNRHNTLRFPELVVDIYSDSTRGVDKTLLTVKDADYRCARVGDAIRNVLNDVGNTMHYWPNGMYIISCLLWTDLRMVDVPGNDGLVHGDMSFALELG